MTIKHFKSTCLIFKKSSNTGGFPNANLQLAYFFFFNKKLFNQGVPLICNFKVFLFLIVKYMIWYIS